MKVKMILPALTEAEGPFWRPIKYSLFPPLGLATLGGYLAPDDEIDLQDQHVETLNLNDEPDLVIIQVYITNAYRSYQIADAYRRRGVYVLLGGLHVTSFFKSSFHHDSHKHKLKHLLYAGGWKKFEALWNLVIKSKNLNNMLPLLESILAKVKSAADVRTESILQNGTVNDSRFGSGVRTGDLTDENEDARKEISFNDRQMTATVRKRILNL